jgi:hypothetical protein
MPTTVEDYQNTKPPPPPPDAKGPGRWVGNQWVSDAVYPPGTGGFPAPGAGIDPNFPTGLTPPPGIKTDYTSDWRPPGSETPAAPPTTTTSSTSSSGGSSAAAPPSTRTLSSTYNDIIGQLLNTSGPSNVNAPTVNMPAASKFDQLVYDQIMKMLNGPTAEEVGKTAASSLPVAAYRNSMVRDLGVQQAGAAEQAGLNGTQGSGGFAGRTEALKQAAGESTAKFTGEYVDKAMADRRAELEKAMTMAQSQGQFEDAQALQAELARVDAQLRAEQNANQRYATEVQKLLGLSDTELRRYLGEMQNDTSRYGIDVTAGTNADRLGFDYASKQADLRQKYIDAGLTPPF